MHLLMADKTWKSQYIRNSFTTCVLKYQLSWAFKKECWHATHIWLQESRWIETGTICFWFSLLFYALIPVGTTYYALHFYLLCLKVWLTLMLKNVLKQSHNVIVYCTPDDCFFPFGGRGLHWTFRFWLSSEGHGHFQLIQSRNSVGIVLSESDVGIELEVAELELSSAMLSLLPLTWV